MSAFSLLEIEREDDHLAVAAGDGIGVLAQVGVLQFAGMVLVEGIAKTVAELQLGDELEEGQIEIAAQSDFKEKVGALQPRSSLRYSSPSALRVA